MAENIERHVSAQRAVADGHFVDRTRHDRAAGFGQRHARCHGVEIEPEGDPACHVGAQHAQHATGTAAGVKDGAAGRGARKGVGELAGRQLQEAHLFDHVVLNDEVDRAAVELTGIVRDAIAAAARRGSR